MYHIILTINTLYSLFISLQIMQCSFSFPFKYLQPYWMDLKLPGIASLSQGYWTWGQLGGATMHCALSFASAATCRNLHFYAKFRRAVEFFTSPPQFISECCSAKEKKNAHYICVIFSSCNVRWLSRWNVFGKFK